MSELEIKPNKKSIETKVGIFSLFAIVVTIIAYSWLTGFLQKREMTDLKAKFNFAGKIEKGSPVSIFGVEKGKVIKIEVLKDGILVYFRVKLDFPLTEGTEFLIRDTDLMGGVVLAILPGKGTKPLDLQKIQTGSKVVGMENIIVEMSRISAGLNEFFDKVGDIGSLITNLQSIVENSQKTVITVNSSIQKNSVRIEEIIKNLEITSTAVSEILAENKNSINSTLQTLPKLLSDMETSLKQMNELSANFGKISQKMTKADGSFQRLISEKDLYDNLLKSAADLDSLILDIKNNPKKYFKVKVF